MIQQLLSPKTWQWLVLPALLVMLLLASNLGYTAEKVGKPSADEANTPKAANVMITVDPQDLIKPLELVRHPEQFLNQTVVFDGVFSSFSSLALDYPKAERSSKEYVTILIRRPDVSHHEIPLGELKLFFPRNKSDMVMNLEVGDRIRIEGKVFSTALNEPWVDIQRVQVLQKVGKKEAECASEC